MSNDTYKVGWTDPRAIMSEGSVTMSNIGIRDSTTTPYKEMKMNYERLEYILQRTVPNYDDMVAQYNALKDIEESNDGLR